MPIRSSNTVVADDWNPEDAKRQALAFLDSAARKSVSDLRITNGKEDLAECAAAGMQILREHGVDLLRALVPHQTSELLRAE